jgi:hypothetical protein
MSESSSHSQERGPLHRSVEMSVAVLMAVFGGVVIFGSTKVGIGWGPEGPKAGFFPFYLGLAIITASIVNFGAAYSAEDPKRLFAEWTQLGKVLSVVIPIAIYVSLVPWLGIYVCSVVLITVFMVWLGRYNIAFSAGLAFAVVAAVYLMFEKWFLVPLPKGPIEDLLRL